MAILRPCLDCGTLSSSSRCPAHATAYRETTNPWSYIYSTREWQRARARVRRRDGFRCTYTVQGRRCANVFVNTFLEVHHVIPLRKLWEQANKNMDEFVRLATDEQNLKLLCGRHHRIEEYDRPQQAQTEKATAKARKSKRHGSRQYAKKQAKSTRDERMNAKWKHQ